MWIIKDIIRYFLHNNFILNKYIKSIDYHSRLADKDLNDIKFLKLKKLINFSYNNSVFYKKLYDNHQVKLSEINCLEDINKLPSITKQDVKDHYKDIITGNIFFLQKGYTSGTSGSPLTIYRNMKSIFYEHALIDFYRKRTGFDKKRFIVSLRGNLDSTKLWRVDILNKILYISSYKLNDSNIQEISNVLSKYNPIAIEAYPSSVYTLSILLSSFQNKINIPLVYTSSETLYGHQRTKIERTFNSKVYDWYGNAERTICLWQEKTGLYKEPPLYSVNEFNNDGVITTNLFNFSFPLIRYEVDDIIIREGEDIVEIGGRVDDSIILEDGTVIGSAALSLAFKDIEGLRHTQIIQKSHRELTIMIVSDNFEAVIVFLRSSLSKILDGKINLVFISSEEEELKRSKSGKFKLVINQISN